MSNVVRIKKGLDINLAGAPQEIISAAPMAETYAVKPDDFKGFTAKLLVKQGDVVKAGSPVFFDKYRPEVLVTSPVSGTVSSVNRGEKRKILEVVIVPDKTIEYLDFGVAPVKNMSREQIIEIMQKAGLWSFIIQRPYGIIADAAKTPKAVFVSGFDSSPLAPDMSFVLQKEGENIDAAIEVLSKLTSGKVHLGLNVHAEKSVLDKVKGAEVTMFDGPHPAGNVGVQIHHVAPVNKGETVWTIDVQHLAILGRFFRTGKVDMSKIIALAGSEVKEPQYYSIISGASVESIAKGKIKEQPECGTVRYISGNVLTGQRVDECNYIGFYANQMTVIPEGDKYELLGWIAPRLDKFSVSRSYFSWLCPKKAYNLDTNLNGGERALVMTGMYDKYLPMDIYPIYLLKAIIAEDIDKMENLGIYEVVEEDFALCEFVDPSKTEMQEIIRQGINLMIKELN